MSARYVSCMECETQTSLTTTQAQALGWALGTFGGNRRRWACPECAYEWRREQQAAYDEAWPTMDLPGGYGS